MFGVFGPILRGKKKNETREIFLLCLCSVSDPRMQRIFFARSFNKTFLSGLILSGEKLAGGVCERTTGAAGEEKLRG